MTQDEFKQYHFIETLGDDLSKSPLGRYTTHTLLTDPRRLVFMLSRYKFVSKMLAGKKRVLEVGCSDGFGSNVVKQTVGSLLITDFDRRMVDEAIKSRVNNEIDIRLYNFLKGPFADKHDAIYLLDVLEHIEPDEEDVFISNIASSLTTDGVCIIGMPSLESQKFASASSKEGHVNCKSGDDFLKLMQKFFANCFLFSMNDELVHTGFDKMAHYLLCVCVSPK